MVDIFQKHGEKVVSVPFFTYRTTSLLFNIIFVSIFCELAITITYNFSRFPSESSTESVIKSRILSTGWMKKKDPTPNENELYRKNLVSASIL